PTPPAHIYTLSLHDALPISKTLHELRIGSQDFVDQLERVDIVEGNAAHFVDRGHAAGPDLFHHVVLVAQSHADGNIIGGGERALDRKSTRLNSSHSQISYAV